MVDHASKTEFEILTLGHASLIFRVGPLVIYMDPIFDDPHHDGLFEIYPNRSIDPNLLPTPTHILISHRHFDHFDINTLARLDRSLPVIIPADPMMRDALKRLGFSDITEVSDYERLTLQSVELYFTPSELKLPEHGVVISFNGVSVWNQVDTMLSDEDLARVVDQFGSFDMVIAPWQPLLEAVVQHNQPLVFPIAEYCRFLVKAARCKGQLTVPGANGFRYRKPYDWQNTLCFPATRERFMQDLEHLIAFDPSRQVAPNDSGDHWVFENGRFHKLSEQVSGVTRHHDWHYEDLVFQPGLTAIVGSKQVRQSGRGSESLSQILERLEDLVNKKMTQDPEAFKELKAWDVVYQITVCDGEETCSFHIPFAADTPQAVPGTSPYATMTTTVNAWALLDLLDHRTSWDHLVHSGAYRTHQTVFRLAPDGIHAPGAEAIADPLWAIAKIEDNLIAKIDRELAAVDRL